MTTIWEQAQGLREEMIARRRNLHQHPETGWTEFRTASMIIKELRALGYEVSFGAAVVDEASMMGAPSAEALASYMEEQPKRRSEPIVSRRMLEQIVFSGTVMTVVGLAFFQSSCIDSLFRGAPDHIYTYTGFFSAFICMAVANAFNVRSKSINVLQNMQANPAFIQVMLLIVAVQVGMTYFGGQLLRTAPLSAQEWLVVAGAAVAMLGVGSLAKLLSKEE